MKSEQETPEVMSTTSKRQGDILDYIQNLFNVSQLHEAYLAKHLQPAFENSSVLALPQGYISLPCESYGYVLLLAKAAGVSDVAMWDQ